MDKDHTYPKQTKKIKHTMMSLSVPAAFPPAVREYQQWMIDSGLPKASQGNILATIALQNNTKLRQIFREKERTNRYGKKYLDAIKSTKAGESAR
ncbi:hypothetical protein HAV21_03345 [Paenarthrobacter sp. MSM-2-10-13]|uniref:hypothetical protein n=1 Tax=Paenarthrobacter sp. MSM-2-10-13 TaxID=2717318 RepID=UPI001422C36B|nr:hypothetical protein [Paenarthrobacter sp. MSM-2-10-13]NHW45933.1 hypothetical protein [Paenarthrobacter sp. MSM-2-10-13]